MFSVCNERNLHTSLIKKIYSKKKKKVNEKKRKLPKQF